MTSIDAIDAFRNAIADARLTPPAEINQDGKIHRFHVTGDKNGSKNGWYVYYDGDLPAGAFGSWKAGEEHKWCGKSTKNLSAAEKAEFQKKVAEAKLQQDQARQHEHEKARQKANILWQKAKPAPAEHPYLIKKGILSHGLRLQGKALLIPMRNVVGEIKSLQFISPDGSKRFLKDGAIRGTYHGIGKPNGTLLICEGYATAASLYEATGHAVACAFNAGNLIPVAEALREKLQDLKLIITGDNDMQTEGNPGVTKATAAAEAVGAALAIPEFKDTTGNPTDFNDLANAEGLETVRAQVECTKPIEAEKNDAQLIDELAKLGKLEYGQQRKDAAKQLRIAVSLLDEIITDKRKPAADSTEITTDCEPWPEPVAGIELYNIIHSNLTRHIILPPGAALSITLWVMLTYCFDAFLILPILTVWSPEKRCGKTTLLSMLKSLVNNGLLASNISPAAVYRVVEKFKPTLLTDEADTFFKNNEELRGIYNSGHTKDGANVIKVNKESMDVEEFSTWAPKAIAMIGKPQDTILDRSIIVKMSRKKRGESAEKKKLTHYMDCMHIRQKAMRWAADNIEKLKRINPDVPDLGNDRMTDNWTPLCAIAENIGSDTPEETQKAMLLLSGGHIDTDSIGGMLIEDIKATFDEKGDDRLSSEDIVAALIEMEHRPWPEWGKSNKGITKTSLANQLKKFDIKPKKLRIGSSVRGYEKEQFKDAFSRYVPETPIQSGTTEQIPKNSNIGQIQSGTQSKGVPVGNPPKQLNLRNCSTVPLCNTHSGEDNTCLDENEETVQGEL